MKLKEYNTETCASDFTRYSVPAVAIHVKSGLFRINKEGIQLMGLTEGDTVVFHQDEEEPTNWYIEKVKDKGFQLRGKDDKFKGLMFNNSKLTRQVAASRDFTGLSGKCLIAGTPTEFKKRQLWGIITGTLINK